MGSAGWTVTRTVSPLAVITRRSEAAKVSSPQKAATVVGYPCWT
ncbi:hypothetical protein O1L44_25140 [Streptomyces noursei]|nr:hypothetical protein [Streptomyces noursei]